VFDPFTRDTVLVPPAGHVAGIYARSDRERGVHKAPANEVVRDIITRDINATRKPLEFTLARGDHDILNPRGINVIRDFRADRRGIRVWGARTLSGDPLWRYVNVRRLFNYVKESVDEGTQWVVFEPNDENTWARVRQVVADFLTLVWRSGALFGATEEQAFFVRCGPDTMTPADIDAGRLIVEVGIAPVKPAEFVIFRFQQKMTELVAA
jgi:phage tail sheath protein FI